VRLWAANKLQTADDHDAAQANVDNALAQWGLQADTPADADAAAGAPDTFYIWPQSVKTWALWQRLQSMWRTSMAGRDGLDWPGVIAWLQHAERMHPKRLARTLQVLRHMERAALDVWAQQAAEKQASSGNTNHKA